MCWLVQGDDGGGNIVSIEWISDFEVMERKGNMISHQDRFLTGYTSTLWIFKKDLSQ